MLVGFSERCHFFSKEKRERTLIKENCLDKREKKRNAPISKKKSEEKS
jgi:hypothetical protein